MKESKAPPGEPLYTVAEMAEKLRVAKMTVYRLINSGQIRALRVGRSFRIPESVYKEYTESIWTDTSS